MVKTSTKEKAKRTYSVLHFIAALVVGVLGTSAAWIVITENAKKPDIYWAWYTGDEEGLSLTSEPEVIVDLTTKELPEEVKIPVRLALRNEGSATAKSVRVELSYPDSLQVISTGQRSIRQEDGLQTFRHDFGDLVPSRSFTPIGSHDWLVLDATIIADNMVLISSDGVPMYTLIFI